MQTHCTSRSLLVGFLLLTVATWVEAQARIHRLGILRAGITEEHVREKRTDIFQKAFEEGLRERGWIPEKNVELVYLTSAKGPIPDAARMDEFLRQPFDVIVAFGNQEAERAQRAQPSVPIVAFLEAGLESGAIKSLARPGVNITGISFEEMAVVKKRLALLKEAAPVTHVGRLYLGPPLRIGNEEEIRPEYRAAARELGIRVTPVFAANADELRTAFTEMAQRGVDGLSLRLGKVPGLAREWTVLQELIVRHRLPAMYDVTGAVNDGGLLAYGDDFADRWRRLPYFIDRILRGAKAADIPIEQPTTFHLAINVKAAEAIGLKLPASILVQARVRVP